MMERVVSETQVRPSMKFGMTRVGVYCVVQGSEPLDNAVWAKYVEDMQREADRMKCVLVYSAGSGPDAKQRTMVADMWKARGKPMPKVCVMSDSTLHRGMITAIAWLLSVRVESGLCAYHPKNAHIALKEMGINNVQERAEVFTLLQKLAAEIRHPELIDRASIVGE